MSLLARTRSTSVIALLALTAPFAGCGKEPSSFEELVCWGGGARAIAQPQDGVTFVDYDVASNFVCGVTSKNALTCWGDKYGLDASVTNYPEGAQAREVKLKYAAGCVIDLIGRPYCWGSGGAANIPPAVHEGKYHSLRVKADTGDFACALDDNGKAVCWGKDYGHNFSWLSSLPSAGLKNLELGAGNVCWSAQGEKAFHCTQQIGSETLTVKQDEEVEQIIPGYGRVCAVTGNHLNCYNDAGRRISHDDDTVYMASDVATCFIRVNGEVVCFDIRGGTPVPFSAQSMVPKDVQFKSVRTGSSTACGARK